MKTGFGKFPLLGRLGILCVIAWACVWMPGVSAQQPAAKAPAAAAIPAPTVRMFATPQQAADALVNAAEAFDVTALTEIFGPDGKEIVFSGEFAQDRKHATEFAAQARKKKSDVAGCFFLQLAVQRKQRADGLLAQRQQSLDQVVA